MPAPVTTLRNVISTFVQEDAAGANNVQNSRMMLKNAATAADREGLITFALPAPKGSKYNSAKLRLFNDGAWAGSRTVTVYMVTGTWSASGVSWSNKPTRTTLNGVSVTKSGAASYTAWEFDITTLLNLASGISADWFGFYVVMTSATSDTVFNFVNERGSFTYVPQVEVSWSVAPEKPTQVAPSGGRYVSVTKPYVTADFVDKFGSTEVAGINVKVSSAADMSSAWDSGDVATSVPQLDLSTTSFPGAASGSTRYMQVRLKDGDGNWSDWSDIVIWKVASKGTLTITSPAASPNNFTGDVTPRVTWTFTGQTQRSWQVLIFKKDGYVLMYDSGKVTSTALEHTVVTPLPLYDESAVYVLEIRVWDALDRITTPNDKAYQVQTREFTLQLSAALAPVANLALVEHGQLPWRTITWTRATAPDYFDILRDGVVIVLNATPASLSTGGTSYAYKDKSASPRTEHEWAVVAKTNAGASKNNPTVEDTVEGTTAWLCSRNDDTIALPMVDYDSGSLELDETVGTYSVLGSDETFVVYQSSRGFAGEFSGTLSMAVGDLTSLDYLRQLIALRSKPGKDMVLTYADQRVVCKVFGINYRPFIFQEETVYLISFKLVEKRDIQR